MYPCRLATISIVPFTPLSRPREQSLEHREAPLALVTFPRCRMWKRTTAHCPLCTYMSPYSRVLYLVQFRSQWSKLLPLSPHWRFFRIFVSYHQSRCVPNCLFCPDSPVECIPSEGWTAWNPRFDEGVEVVLVKYMGQGPLMVHCRL